MHIWTLCETFVLVHTVLNLCADLTEKNIYLWNQYWMCSTDPIPVAINAEHWLIPMQMKCIKYDICGWPCNLNIQNGILSIFGVFAAIILSDWSALISPSGMFL